MDVASAYQNGFLYIRQLSLLLRRSMQQKTKDSFQAVRRWQVSNEEAASFTIAPSLSGEACCKIFGHDFREKTNGY